MASDFWTCDHGAVTLTPEHRAALRRIATRRNRLTEDEAAAIRAAAASGASLREIATEVDRSKSTVDLILKGDADTTGIESSS